MNDKQLTIPINQIFKPKHALRPVRRFKPEYVELVESVKKDGILQPILVRPVQDGFEVVEGWHRYEAAKEAGLSEMPCLIREMTDREVMISQLKCNSIRPKTATFEFARRLKILMEEGWTLTELSAIIDKTPSWIRNQLYLNRLCEEAREPVERGEIPLSSALALANLPEDLQPKFIEDAISLKHVEFAKRAKRALRDYKAYILEEQQEDKKSGVSPPKLRTVNVIKREAVDHKHAKEVLKEVKAKTPLDGWKACMAWLFKLDPITVEGKKSKYEEKHDDALMSIAEFRKTNRELIKKFVKKQTRTGDYKNDE